MFDDFLTRFEREMQREADRAQLAQEKFFLQTLDWTVAQIKTYNNTILDIQERFERVMDRRK